MRVTKKLDLAADLLLVIAVLCFVLWFLIDFLEHESSTESPEQIVGTISGSSNE